MPVHPHTRGDIRLPSQGPGNTDGSPPHAWGHRSRLTGRQPAATVHPHTRGDIALFPRLSAASAGSPPHAWGHRRSPRPGGDRCPVHPHTRGDIHGQLLPFSRACGSPPHAWGHLCLEVGAQLLDRFTPTRVGTSGWQAPPRMSPPVHPHTRGDILASASSLAALSGSPPHAWGHRLSHR